MTHQAPGKSNREGITLVELCDIATWPDVPESQRKVRGNDRLCGPSGRRKAAVDAALSDALGGRGGAPRYKKTGTPRGPGRAA